MPASTDPKALHDQATAALNRGDWPAVVRCCEALLRQDSGFADAWFLLSIAAEAKRDIARAITLVDRAIALRADNPEYLSQKAKFQAMRRALPTAFNIESVAGTGQRPAAPETPRPLFIVGTPARAPPWWSRCSPAIPRWCHSGNCRP